MTPASYIDLHTGDLLKDLTHLVRIPTVNPPGENYGAATEWLAGRLSKLGLRTRRHEISKGLLRRVLPPAQRGFPRYNVLGKLAVEKSLKTIHFNAHYDVVPVSGTWAHGGPFSGEVDGGWIHGRGTADMKGSIASLLLALQSLRATRTPPRMNVEVSFTADEETDSILGSEWLVRHAPINPDYAVVMEGGEEDCICCGHNGNLWLEVAVRGRAAHGSMPQDGVNALEKMSALVLELEGYKRTLARRGFVTPQGRRMRPTINVGGVFHCGEGAKVNTVPAHASFTIDRRILPNESHGSASRELRAFLAAAARRIPGCRIRVSKISENFSCFRPPAHPFFAAMASSLRRVRGTRPSFNVSSGFNDMHFFSHELGIPTLGYGPGGLDFHAVNERVRVRELVACAKVYADILTNFAG